MLTLFISTFFSLTTGCMKSIESPEDKNVERPPNIILIVTDDMGYGDISPYGNPTARTPNFERMAQEGQKWTNFYVASPICTPSRAAILTGRLPVRLDLREDRERQVFFEDSTNGLQPSEVTIAEILKSVGYATAAIGKWHLGHLPQFLPTSQGFDSYFGIPYSNDMDAPGGLITPWKSQRNKDPSLVKIDLMREGANIDHWDVPLMNNEVVIERPADQWTLTQRYTEKAIEFIKNKREQPFFLYLAHSFPHIPLFAGENFWGKNAGGYYADVIEELDHSTGQIMESLESLGLDNDTLVIFTSDNGPWIGMMEFGGSAGALRGGKGSTYEGGMRVPGLFWGPGHIAPGVHTGIGSTLDLLPTIAFFANAVLPDDRTIDGVNLAGSLTQGKVSPRETVHFYRGEKDTMLPQENSHTANIVASSESGTNSRKLRQKLYAIRHGSFKLHFRSKGSFGVPDDGRNVISGPDYSDWGMDKKTIRHHNPPLLFNLDSDPGERYDVSANHPNVLRALKVLADAHTETISETR